MTKFVNVWEEWPSNLRHQNYNRNVPNSNATRQSPALLFKIMGYSQGDCLTNSMLIAVFSTISIQKLPIAL